MLVQFFSRIPEKAEFNGRSRKRWQADKRHFKCEAAKKWSRDVTSRCTNICVLVTHTLEHQLLYWFPPTPLSHLLLYSPLSEPFHQQPSSHILWLPSCVLPLTVQLANPPSPHLRTQARNSVGRDKPPTETWNTTSASFFLSGEKRLKTTVVGDNIEKVVLTV